MSRNEHENQKGTGSSRERESRSGGVTMKRKELMWTTRSIRGRDTEEDKG